VHDLARLAPVAHKLASLLQGCHEARVSFFPATCVFGEIAHHGAFAPFAGLDAARDGELDTRRWTSLAAFKDEAFAALLPPLNYQSPSSPNRHDKIFRFGHNR